MDFDLFVIGGGSAGVRCARIAAGHGARVGIAEERFWGGTCVNVGCVPKKLLVQAGEYGAWADDAAGFGWTIKKGPHDWRKLIAAKDREIGRLDGIYRRLLDGAGAHDLRRPRRVPRSAHAAMSAASASPRNASSSPPAAIRSAPPIPGAELGIISDDAFFLPRMPERVAIVGSGYIAVEFAGIFQALGAEVASDLPPAAAAARLRPWICARVWRRRSAPQGITLHPGCRAAEAGGRRRRNAC